MRKLCKLLGEQLLSNLLTILLPLGGTIIIAILGYLQHVPLFVIALGAMVAPGIILFAFNQYDNRNKKNITKLSDKEIEDLIHKWVDIPAFSCRRLDDEKAYFNFALTDNFKRNVNIIRNKKEPESVDIVTYAILSPKNKKIAQNVWEELASKLSIEMARLGIQFKFIGEENKLNKIQLIEPVFLDDSLTGFYFMQRILFVIRALVLVQEVRNETLTKN